MIRSADVRTESDARNWEARLNQERPQRMQAANWITAQISASSGSSLRVVELACGAGFLAEVLRQQVTGICYCGFDLSPHLLESARRRFEIGKVQRDDESVMEFRRADLVNDDWTAQLAEMGWFGEVDAVVSIQALHDLGDLAQQTKVLKQARGLLRDGGLLAYGDLLFDADDPHPSRYSSEEHDKMLRECGFSVSGGSSVDRNRVESCTQGIENVTFGDFGCFACYK